MHLITTEKIEQADLAELRALAPDLTVTHIPVAEVEKRLTEYENADIIRGTFGPMAGGYYGLFQKVLQHAPRVRWVHTSSAGVDAMICPEFFDDRFVVTCAKGEMIGSLLAESAFAMLLALTRGILPSVRANGWARGPEVVGSLTEIRGRTMGIVGFGGGGRALAERAVAFGMDVIAIRRHPTEPPPGVRAIWGPDRLNDLMAEADVVVSITPNTPETRGMFGREQFRLMKKTAYFVVVGRGQTMDPEALTEALREGWFAGAALDVLPWSQPWGPEMPLWNLPNVLITSHIAGASRERNERSRGFFVENFRRFVRGEPLQGLVDKEAQY